MSRSRALPGLLALVLALGACGDAPSTEPTTDDGGVEVDEDAFLATRAQAFATFDSGRQKKKALELLLEVDAMRPGLYGVNRRLGLAYSDMKLHDEALTRLQAALDVKPEDVQTRLAVVLLLHRLGHADEALERLPPLLQDPTHRGQALHVQASIHYERGAFEEALATVSLAADLPPERGWRCAALHGQLLAEDGHHADAVAHFERALSGRPDAKEALSGLARSHHRLGNAEEAEHWDGIHRLFMDLTDDVYMKSRKRAGDRLVALRRVVEVYPAWVDGFRQLAELAASQGHGDEACATIRRLIDTHPEEVPGPSRDALVARYCEGS